METKPTILVTEDDAAIRDVLLKLLIEEGYPVVAVDDIAAARTELASNPFAVLLLDSHYGESQSGLAWLEDFVSHEGAPRVIILSGSAAAPALGKRFNVKTLGKPFDIDELMAEIVAVTQSNRRAKDSEP